LPATPPATPVNSVANINYTIYPNPASDKLYVDFSSVTQLNAYIYNVSGVLVKQANLNSVQNDIDISSLSSQSYIVVLKDAKTAEQVLINKFLKE
jgi:hypothetical protein